MSTPNEPQLDQVGIRSKVYRDVLESGMVSEFARVAQDKRPAHIPPTIITRCRKGEFELLEVLHVPLSAILHGEQEYKYYAPFKMDQELEYQTVFKKFFEKDGTSAVLKFLVFETELRTTNRTMIAKAVSTMIMRVKK